MTITKTATGNILDQISNAFKLSDLRFSSVSSFAALSVKFIEDMELELYSGFSSRSKTASIFGNLCSYKNSLYNLKNIASEIELTATKYDLMVLSAENSRMKGIPPSPQEVAIRNKTHDSIMIRTAKLHEYEASLLIELDTLAEKFFARKNKINWIEKKMILQQQANGMMPSKEVPKEV